ncbi:MAG: germination protein YpeB [Halanaerobium sp.]|nr:germination protein YpeB [Halanaerobium sp.]
MKRDYWIPLGLALVVLVGVLFWGIDQYTENRQLATYLGNRYQDAFNQMTSHMENLENLLNKSLASASPSQNIIIFTNIWREAFSAQDKLGMLPIAREPVLQTEKYLTQVGDFAYTLAKTNAKGKVLSSEQRDILRRFRAKLSSLLEDLQDVRTDVLAGRFNWVEMIRGASTRMRKEIQTLQNNFVDRLSNQMEGTPQLIYDGPFSDHIEDRQPKGLTGAMISQDEAAERVLDFIDVRNKDQYRITFDDNIDSKIKAYRFQVTPRDDTGADFSVDVSNKGGHIITMTGYREVRKREFTQEQSKDVGAEFLRSRGYQNMVPTFSMVQNNIATVAYVYKEDDVIIYPDQVKVDIALDDGRVLGIEALSYYMSHRVRNLPKPKITAQEAKDLANSELDIENVILALIPLASGDEVLTYEVRGRMEGETFLVYINAETGDEEKILRVKQSENGQFAL